MRRPRHRPLSSGQLSIALLSVLALVACACVGPALAQAEECTDSSCKQYEVEIPTADNGGDKPKKHKSQNNGEPEAEASESPKNNQGNTPPSGGNSEESEESKGTATPGGNNGNGNNGPTDKGNPSSGGNGSNQASTGVGDGQSLGGSTAEGQPASHSSGGSSPLVPILIAIAVLAAISIGAVIYRQRRQGSGGTGSPVSPNA